MYYEVEPIDINFKQFLFTHWLYEQFEKSNWNFFYIDSKNRLKTSLHWELINIESKDIVLAINWNIWQIIKAPEYVVKVFKSEMLLEPVKLTNLVSSYNDHILIGEIVWVISMIFIQVYSR